MVQKYTHLATISSNAQEEESAKLAHTTSSQTVLSMPSDRHSQQPDTSYKTQNTTLNLNFTSLQTPMPNLLIYPSTPTPPPHQTQTTVALTDLLVQTLPSAVQPPPFPSTLLLQIFFNKLQPIPSHISRGMSKASLGKIKILISQCLMLFMVTP
jgi:hypothetical protein